MTSISVPAPGRRVTLCRYVLAALLVFGAAMPAGAAAPLDGPVVFDGVLEDAAGAALDGIHTVSLTYRSPSGEELFVERFDGVDAHQGRLRLELGAGVAAASRYADLAAVFAAYPELAMAVTVDGVDYGPAVGILPAGHSLKSRLVAAGVRSDDDGQEHWKHYGDKGGATAVQSRHLSPAAAGGAAGFGADPTVRRDPYTLPVIGPKLSRPVRELPLAVERAMRRDSEVNPPRHESLYDADGNRFGTQAPREDDWLAGSPPNGRRTPGLSLSFEGINNVNGVLPPDTEGTVGPNHYVQVVNLSFAIYDKSGTRLTGPSNTNTLWSGFGGPCQTDNSGDAIFAYDQQADRFVLTQFAVAGSHQSVCFAVSTSPDPTGTYYLYEVVTPRFPDYYKLGVWPDPQNSAYFFGTNSGFQGQYDVFAVDRDRMLTGSTARPMQFFQNFVNLMMPADVDGPNTPPFGSPGIFYTFRDGGESYFGSPPTDSIDIWEFDVDWTTPSNSTFSLVRSLTPADGLATFNWTVCGFFVSNCIPQPGTSQGIDSASWWPMQRLVYRNFGSHETLLGSWTVDVLASGNRAAPRWFELRDVGSGWTLYQQGTHSPDAIHRWMPSVAMDGAGNIAIGYSRGDGSNFPSIYYATRDAGDPLGTLQSEALLFAGTGSQTHSAARWGDYSSMELDPADDCTFWYTTEYLATTGSAPWRTRIGAFSVPGCGGPFNNPPVVTITTPADGSSFEIGTSVSFSGTATDAEDGSLTSGLSWTSSLDGVIGSGGSFATSSLSAGTHTITASVTDSGGANGADAITVTITVPTGIRLSEDFESGLGAWSAGGLWHVAANSPCASPGYSSPVSSAYYGQDSTCNYDAGANSGDLISPVVTGINGGSELSFDFYRQVESYTGGSYDQAEVAVSVAGSGSWTQVWFRDSTNTSLATWTPSGAISLAAWAGSDIQLRFRFDSVDGSFNTFTGWMVDDVVVTGDLGGGNTPPSVTITAPADGSSFTQGDSVAFAGTATDAEDGSLSSSLAWTSSLDGAIGSGASFSTSSLSVGTHTITASVTDSGGLPGSDAITVTIDPTPNTPPSVTIAAPADGSSFTQGDSVAFAGTATDAEDGSLSSSLAWTSSLDGAIGSGASFSTSSLSVGTHTITASVTDSGGLPGSDAITVTIDPGPNSAPSVTITAPADGSTFTQGTNVTFSGTATDAEDGDLSSSLSWTSSLDGSIGSGASFATSSLSVGAHTITASVTDSGGLPGSDAITVTIEPPVGGNPKIWMSFKTNTSVPGVGTVTDEDIVSYDEVTGTWALEFDGSDVGIGVLEIDGFTILPGGDLLLSFTVAADFGAFVLDDSDIVRFTPTSLGSNTSGTFSFYFDGSDVGLSSSNEDIDALGLTADGRLVISTLGSISANGASGADEDLWIFNGTVGETTVGSFEQLFDGSDVGLSTSSSEDVDAAGLTSSGNLLFSTVGDFSVTGLSGENADVVEFSGTFGTSTSGTFSMRLDLTALGIDITEDLGALEIVE